MRQERNLWTTAATSSPRRTVQPIGVHTKSCNEGVYVESNSLRAIHFTRVTVWFLLLIQPKCVCHYTTTSLSTKVPFYSCSYSPLLWALSYFSSTWTKKRKLMKGQVGCKHPKRPSYRQVMALHSASTEQSIIRILKRMKQRTSIGFQNLALSPKKSPCPFTTQYSSIFHPLFYISLANLLYSCTQDFLKCFSDLFLFCH